MIGANLANVLAKTLNSGTIESSSLQLKRMRTINGFVIELLIISDDVKHDAAIRQSALIYLKNVIQDHCNQGGIVPHDDMTSIKNSLLEAIIRNVTNKQLAPTFKQIIFQLAQKYYPKEWPQIIDQALLRLSKATDFAQILGCVQTLRAVFSVFGGSILKEIELSNLCNKALLPLFSLASNLFQNFNADTAVIMMSTFKLFSTVITFHIPPIVQVNIHNLMIFVKKILDLNIALDDSNSYIYHLKKICLRILFRIYQRHANIKLTNCKQFAVQFHAKYTKSFVQTLIYQVMSDGGKDKVIKHRHLELVKLSLSCLAYINRQNPEAATLLIQHRDAIVNLCLQRFRLSFNRSYQNFIDFKVYIQEDRVHLKEFFFSLMRCEALPEQQGNAVTSLLSLLLSCLQNGDNQLKQLTLYIFAEMSAEIQFLNTSLEENMTLLIVTYVKPLLQQEYHILVRARACQLLASYNYLQLPDEQLIQIATLVYNCLLAGTSQKQTFLKIYACNAFNSILKYNSIVQFVKPHLQDILKIYTSLLEADVSIIKNFQDLLNLLEDDIAPFANDLVLLLINLFHNYSKQDSSHAQQNLNSYGNSTSEDNEDDDDDSFMEEDDSNNENIAKACISSIRQILQAQTTDVTSIVKQELFGIVVNIFVDPSQLYIEEGYNILNLLLYKLKNSVESKYYIFFKVIAYAILGVPSDYISNLKNRSNFDKQFAQILQNICIQPDDDLLQNCIGCIRNFIAKSTSDVLWNEKDDFNIPLMEYLFKIVKFVHENANKKCSQTDRLIVLTIYITLIEYRILNQRQVSEVINTVVQWMQMQQESVEQNNNNFGVNAVSKYIYSSIYLQIIMLSIHFYGNVVINQININTILNKIVYLQENFKCDYEISRIIIAISDLLEQKVLNDQNIIGSIMNALPQFIRKLCKIRQEGDNQLNDMEMDDEAEEDKLFGDDENSLMIGWKQNNANATEKDLLLKEGNQQEEDDNDWEEEFNKFYDSPFDKIDQIKWLENVLKGEGSSYCTFMNKNKQEELALYFANMPPKNQ